MVLTWKKQRHAAKDTSARNLFEVDFDLHFCQLSFPCEVFNFIPPTLSPMDYRKEHFELITCDARKPSLTKIFLRFSKNYVFELKNFKILDPSEIHQKYIYIYLKCT